MSKDYERGIKAALRAVSKRVPLKRAKEINEFADMAGMDSADVFHDAVAEVQAEMRNRLLALLPPPYAPPSPAPAVGQHSVNARNQESVT